MRRRTWFTPVLLVYTAVWAVLRVLMPSVLERGMVGVGALALGLPCLALEYARSVDLNVTRFTRDLVAAIAAVMIVEAVLVHMWSRGSWQLLDAFVAFLVLVDIVVCTFVTYSTALRNFAGSTRIAVSSNNNDEGEEG